MQKAANLGFEPKPTSWTCCPDAHLARKSYSAKPAERLVLATPDLFRMKSGTNQHPHFYLWSQAHKRTSWDFWTRMNKDGCLDTYLGSLPMSGGLSLGLWGQWSQLCHRADGSDECKQLFRDNASACFSSSLLQLCGPSSCLAFPMPKCHRLLAAGLIWGVQASRGWTLEDLCLYSLFFCTSKCAFDLKKPPVCILISH